MLSVFKGILQASHDLVREGTELVQQLFPGELGKFSDSVCESWDATLKIPHLPVGSDILVVHYQRGLCQLFPFTTGCLHSTGSCGNNYVTVTKFHAGGTYKFTFRL